MLFRSGARTRSCPYSLLVRSQSHSILYYQISFSAPYPTPHHLTHFNLFHSIDHKVIQSIYPTPFLYFVLPTPTPTPTPHFYSSIQCNAMQCNAMQCNAMQCNAIQSNAIRLVGPLGQKSLSPRSRKINPDTVTATATDVAAAEEVARRRNSARLRR